MAGGIDHSMYLNRQGPDYSNIGKGIEQGLRIGEMFQQRRDAQQGRNFNEALKGAMRTNASGQLEVDESQMGNLAQIDPMQAQAIQKQMFAQKQQAKQIEREQLKAYAEEAAPAYLAIGDQESLMRARSALASAGNPFAKELPEVYDPKHMDFLKSKVTPIAQRFAKEKEIRELNAKGYDVGPDGKVFAIKGGEAELERNRKGLDAEKTREEIAKLRREAGGNGGNNVAAAYAKKGAEEKQKIGMIVDAFRSIKGFEEQLNSGAKPGFITPQTPILGSVVSSNPITEATDKLADDIGRLRSGGAINADEESRFQRMLPRAADNPETRKRKLDSLRTEMTNKLSAYGVRKEDLGQIGFDPKQLGLDGAGDKYESMDTAEITRMYQQRFGGSANAK